MPRTRTPMILAHRLTAAGGAVLLATACQARPNTVTLDPQEADIYGTTAVMVNARVKDANQQDVRTTVRYTSSNTTAATVPARGVPASPNFDYPVTVRGEAVVEDDTATITGIESATGATGTMKVRVHPAMTSGATVPPPGSGVAVDRLQVYPSVRPYFVYEYRLAGTSEIRAVNVTFARAVDRFTVIRHAGSAARAPRVVGGGASWVVTADQGTTAPTSGYTELVVRAEVEGAPPDAQSPAKFDAIFFRGGLRVTVENLGPMP